MDDVEMSEVGAGGGAEAGAPEEEKVMADSGVAATVSVSLHPLVIMNISEHWTRSDYPRSPHLVSNVVGAGPRRRRGGQCRCTELSLGNRMDEISS